MSRHAVYLLAADAAMAFAIRYLPSPHRLSDARLFAAGNLSLWDGWETLPEADRVLVTRFLKLRPDAIAEDWFFLRQAAESLDKAQLFQWQQQIVGDVANSTFEAVPGKPLDQVIDELLTDLAAKRQSRVPADVARSDTDTVYLSAHKASFAIPVSHLSPEQSPWPDAPHAQAHPSLILDRSRLVAMADRLDGAGLSGNHHREVVEKLLGDVVVGRAGQPFGDGRALSSGRTNLVVAPTGRGKSVLARVLALDSAERGIGVAIVLPDIKEVLKECHELEQFAAALGLPITVAPINSAASLLGKAEEFLRHPPRHDPTGQWTLDRLSYYCRLSAYAVGGRVEPGDEPCFRLRCSDSEANHQVRCPFARTCPKFDTFAAATRATILVVNHFAFLSGRVPIPLKAEADAESRMSVMELVLRRCPVVLIDEIDQFQQRAIDQSVGSLQISSRPRLSPLHELFDSFERKRAANEFPLDVPVEPARRQMHLLSWLPGLLADLLNREAVAWPDREAMRWSGARDGWLSARLFGEADDASERFEALFGTDPIASDDASERLRRVVRGWVAHDLEEDRDTTELRAELMTVLGAWPRPFGPQPSRTSQVMARIADGIVLRALLSRLEQALNRLRPQLATLEQFSLDRAADVRDALLGYIPWRASPAGPLGRRVVGFSFQRYGEDPGALHAQALAGDPHSFVSGIGDETALALVGTKRVVIGLSATARFAGSPNCDVIAPIAMFQPDEADGIFVEDASVQDTTGDGAPVRISGLSAAQGRHERAGRLGFLLWDRYLRDHLAALAADEKTRGRARVLLVTGSYDEARIVAQALSRAIGSTSEADARIRYLARDRESGDAAQVLLSRELDGFASTGADILIAPLAVVCRGHNILQPGRSVSAIASIFVLVRPVPPVDNAARALAHVSYDAIRHAQPSATPGDAIAAVRRRAEQQLRYLQRNTGPFGYMPADLRHHILCDVLVDLAQLAGRARRGGTDVRLYLVDGAFHDDHVGWKQLISKTFARWRDEGVLGEMQTLHRSFLTALSRFSGQKEG